MMEPLKTEWIDFIENLPGDYVLPEAQERAMKFAFYAGAYKALKIQYHAVRELPHEDALHLMLRVTMECNDFFGLSHGDSTSIN